MKIQQDPVPIVYTGPRTIRCGDCGYESTWVIPEEIDSMFEAMLTHIQQHGIQIPQFEVTIY